MCDASQVSIGTIVMVRLGRNEIEVVVTEIGDNTWKVKKVGSDKTFSVSRIERIVREPETENETGNTNWEDTMNDLNTSEVAGEEAENPIPAGERTAPRKLSLLNAAVKVLEESDTPLNVKEMIAKAEAAGLWANNGAKTPEQSLYSALFREIKEKESPRIRKSETRRGAFEFCR